MKLKRGIVVNSDPTYLVGNGVAFLMLSQKSESRISKKHKLSQTLIHGLG